MSEPKVLLVGNGSNLNRGCEAILRSTEQLIVSHFGRVCLENHFLCQPEDLQSSYLADPASPSASRSAPLLIARKGRTPRDRGLRLAARLTGSGRLLASSARYI
jgi:hypothetical protein